MLIMQAISVVFLWTINTLPIDGQTIFLMFLSADFLTFGSTIFTFFFALTS